MVPDTQTWIRLGQEKEKKKVSPVLPLPCSPGDTPLCEWTWRCSFALWWLGFLVALSHRRLSVGKDRQPWEHFPHEGWRPFGIHTGQRKLSVFTGQESHQESSLVLPEPTTAVQSSMMAAVSKNCQLLFCWERRRYKWRGDLCWKTRMEAFTRIKDAVAYILMQSLSVHA